MSLSSTWASTDRIKGSLGSPFCSSTLGAPGISTRNLISVLRYSRQAGACAHAAVETRSSGVAAAASAARAHTTWRRDQFGSPNTECDDMFDDIFDDMGAPPALRGLGA